MRLTESTNVFCILVIRWLVQLKKKSKKPLLETMLYCKFLYTEWGAVRE